jgi:hypothetical protein
VGGGFCPFFTPPPKYFGKYFGASDTCHRPPVPVTMCKEKMIILSFQHLFPLFFLTRATRPRRDAARCGVGRADRRPPSGRDRGCACAEVERERRQAVCDKTDCVRIRLCDPLKRIRGSEKGAGTVLGMVNSSGLSNKQRTA